MNKYINQSDAIDILDNLWDKVGNNSRDFYLQLRKGIYDLSTEEIIHCKDCKFYIPMNRETKSGICNLTLHQNFGDDWYCAGAERK